MAFMLGRIHQEQEAGAVGRRRRNQDFPYVI
jgi:hypothetical protein